MPGIFDPNNPHADLTAQMNALAATMPRQGASTAVQPSFRNTASTNTTAPPATPATPIQGSTVSTDASPAVRVVDQPKETVQGQLGGIMATDAPYMQSARTRAAQAANARGLLNSSIAVSAGEAAAYDAALPVANADAQTFKSAGDANFNAQSEFGMQRLRGDQALDLADIQARHQSLIQANASASSTFAQMSRDMQSVMSNANLNPQAKQALLTQQRQLLESALAVIGGISNLDLNRLLVFG